MAPASARSALHRGAAPVEQKLRRVAALPVLPFRPGLPEVNSTTPIFGAVKQSPAHQGLFVGPSGEFHPAAKPEANEIVVIKHRVSAFCGTDLDMILRAQNIQTLILFGIATSGVVLSTALHASAAERIIRSGGAGTSLVNRATSG